MPIMSGGIAALPGRMLYEEVTFTETSGSGVYTGSVTVPPKSWLLDVKVYPVALWDNTGTAVLKVGDAATSRLAALALPATRLLRFARNDTKSASWSQSDGLSSMQVIYGTAH